MFSELMNQIREIRSSQDVSNQSISAPALSAEQTLELTCGAGGEVGQTDEVIRPFQPSGKVERRIQDPHFSNVSNVLDSAVRDPYVAPIGPREQLYRQLTSDPMGLGS